MGDVRGDGSEGPGPGVAIATKRQLRDVMMEFRFASANRFEPFEPRMLVRRDVDDGAWVGYSDPYMDCRRLERPGGFRWQHLDDGLQDLLRRAAPLAQTLAVLEVESRRPHRTWDPMETWVPMRHRPSGVWEELAIRLLELERAAVAVRLLATVGWYARPEVGPDAEALESFVNSVIGWQVELSRSRWAQDRSTADDPAELLGNATNLCRTARGYLERRTNHIARLLEWVLLIGESRSPEDWAELERQASIPPDWDVCPCGSDDVAGMDLLGDLDWWSRRHELAGVNGATYRCRTCTVLPEHGQNGPLPSRARWALRPPAPRAEDRIGRGVDLAQLVSIASELRRLASLSRHCLNLEDAIWLHDRVLVHIEPLQEHLVWLRARPADGFADPSTARPSALDEEIVPSRSIDDTARSWDAIGRICVTIELFAVELAEVAVRTRTPWRIDDPYANTFDPVRTPGWQMIGALFWATDGDIGEFAKVLLRLAERVIWEARLLENDGVFLTWDKVWVVDRSPRVDPPSLFAEAHRATSRRGFRDWYVMRCVRCESSDVDPCILGRSVEPVGVHLWFCWRCSGLPLELARAHPDEAW